VRVIFDAMRDPSTMSAAEQLSPAAAQETTLREITIARHDEATEIGIAT
jgi:hypothetical protein